METWNEKLKESADRLIEQGSSFLATTRGAGETFVQRAKSAGGAFWSETWDAGNELVTQTREAQKELVGTVQQEAEVWIEFFRSEGLDFDALPKLSAPAALESLKVPSPREVEKRILTGIGSALSDLEARVQQRLVALEQTAALPASTGGRASKKNGAAKKNGKAASSKKNGAAEAPAADAPITGYEKLTAREIVTKAQKLDRKKVEALLAYEEGTKNRATVVSALRARLEA